MTPEESRRLAGERVAKMIGYPSFSFVFAPRDYQLEAIERGLVENSLGLGFDMGTGKTFTVISILRTLFVRHKDVLPTVIICPKSVMESWRRELVKHLHRSNHSFIAKLTGSELQRLKQVRDKSKRIFIVNIEAASTMKLLMREIRQRHIHVLILDESQRIKRPYAKRTQAILKLASEVKYKYLLSGTPVLKNFMDLWSQLRALGADVDENFRSFQWQYFYDENAGMPKERHFPSWQLRPDTLPKLQALVAKHWIFKKAEEVMDLPPLVRESRFVDLEGDQLSHYQAMELDFITYLDDERAVVADLTLTKLLRLQEIAAGVLSLDDRSRKLTRSNAKLKALQDILEDRATDHKIIVWTAFSATYDMIGALCDQLELKHCFLVGGQSEEVRQKMIDAFNTDPSIRVCIANPGAAGVGIGLQAASVAIYFSKTFNLEHDLQSIKRCHRGGSEIHQRIQRIDLIASGTIDEDITESLERKQALGELITGFRRRVKQ